MQPLKLESLLPYLWISGRSSRREWWRIHMLCAITMFMFDQMFHARVQHAMSAGGLSMQSVSVLWLLATAALSWISWTSVVRRLHDRGKSGWWSLLYLFPGIGWLWLIIECGFLPARVPAVAAAPAPAFVPQPEPQQPRRAIRAPRATTSRVGTIQRVEYRALTPDRLMKMAGNAVGLIVLGFVLYQWFFDTRPLPVFELPAKSELVE
jgi:uncharacterized membrane protein YhaH (DUF805 family)